MHPYTVDRRKRLGGHTIFSFFPTFWRTLLTAEFMRLHFQKLPRRDAIFTHVVSSGLIDAQLMRKNLLIWEINI